MIGRRMTRSLVATLVLMAVSVPATAQQVSQDRPTREQLLRQIEQRFMARATESMGLDAEQAERLRSTVTQYAVERRRLEQLERAVKRALSRQLRPGVAADQDSLLVLLDGLMEARSAYVESFRKELAEMEEYLDPVQRAQYLMLRDQLIEQIRRVRYSGRQGQSPGGQRQDF